MSVRPSVTVARTFSQPCSAIEEVPKRARDTYRGMLIWVRYPRGTARGHRKVLPFTHRRCFMYHRRAVVVVIIIPTWYYRYRGRCCYRARGSRILYSRGNGRIVLLFSVNLPPYNVYEYNTLVSERARPRVLSPPYLGNNL